MLRKNQYLLRYSLPHYSALYCAASIRHLQSQHPVSTFGIEKVFGSMKTLPAIRKMLVSLADFSTRPVGRVLWEESLVLSKIHSSIRADEWNFCPLCLYTCNCRTCLDGNSVVECLTRDRPGLWVRPSLAALPCVLGHAH